MPIYCTRAEFEADPRLGGWTTSDVALLDKHIDAAEKDIDAYVGPWNFEANGRKFGAPKTTNEKGLSDTQKTALRDATIAQAYYRIQRGPEFMLGDQFASTSGPDFSTTGKLSRVSPAAKQDLAGSGLVLRATRVA